METLNYIFIFLVFLQLAIYAEGEETNRKVTPLNSRGAREFYHHYAAEEEKKNDYPELTYSSSHYPIRQEPPECPQNPLMPILGNGLNFLLLKLGAIGIVKAVLALIFLGFLVKIPILLVKLAFLKSFFLPVLLAPLLLNYFSNNMMTTTTPATSEKPSDSTDSADPMGRKLEEVFSTTAMQSAQMVLNSEKCLERIACAIGSHSNETSMGFTFNRMLKYLQYSSPLSIQHRLASVRQAFKIGRKADSCSSEDYPCQSPELILQQGMKQFRVL